MANQAGRPARSKESYRNEIQRLKKNTKEIEKEKLFLKLTLDRYVDKVMRYEMAPVPKRIKYLIVGEI